MNPLGIGYQVLAVIVTIALIIVGLLIGGVVDKTTADVYAQLNITGTWATLRQTTVNYAQQGINIMLIAIILTALGVVLVVIFGFMNVVGGGRIRAEFVRIAVKLRNAVVVIKAVIINGVVVFAEAIVYVSARAVAKAANIVVPAV